MAVHWFSLPANQIANELLGYKLELGKIRNLVSFANGDIDLWSYLSLVPREHRESIGEEWVNFILGPLAAHMKLENLNFEDRDMALHVSGAVMLIEAMALGLIPPGKRKELYEALIMRYGYEVEAIIPTEGSYVPEHCARLTFYTILADVIAPIFDEASADDLGDMILKVLADNPKQAGEAKDDPKVVGWIMGQVMRASPTKLDPNTVRAAIIERL